MTITENISRSCNCNEIQAQEYLEDELRNLRELQALNDLRYSDLEEACKGLGLDFDWIHDLITTLTVS